MNEMSRNQGDKYLIGSNLTQHEESVVNQEIARLKRESWTIKAYTEQLKSDHESKTTIDSLQQLSQLTLANANNDEQMVQEKRAKLLENSLFIIGKMKQMDLGVRNVFDRFIYGELISWKRHQQLRELNSKRLDVLQCWFGILTQIVWSSINDIEEIKILATNLENEMDSKAIRNEIQDMYENMTTLLCLLMANSFIVEKQPSQVIQTAARFHITVRLLINEELCNLMQSPKVTVKIINETQANDLVAENKLKDEAGEILGNTGSLVYDTQTHHFSVTLSDMRLKTVKRSKNNSDSEFTDKFVFAFFSNIQIGEKFEFPIWTLSLPVIVIAKRENRAAARGTIFWDNEFATPSRRLFSVLDNVKWCRVAAALNMNCYRNTKRELSPENLNYLAERLFGKWKSEYASQQVSQFQFLRAPLEHGFTFWQWFHAIIELIRDYLEEYWKNGHIVGFIRKEEAQGLLNNCAPGTFLIRFSDSVLGAIIIAYRHEDGDGDGNKVEMWGPLTGKEFANKCLADIINDLVELKFLYPDFPKDKIFPPTARIKNAQTARGYKPIKVITKIASRDGSEDKPLFKTAPPSCSCTDSMTLYQRQLSDTSENDFEEKNF